jgi:hypothetical protein
MIYGFRHTLVLPTLSDGIIAKEDFEYERYFNNCVKVLSNTKDQWVKETLKSITE